MNVNTPDVASECKSVTHIPLQYFFMSYDNMHLSYLSSSPKMNNTYLHSHIDICKYKHRTYILQAMRQIVVYDVLSVTLPPPSRTESNCIQKAPNIIHFVNILRTAHFNGTRHNDQHSSVRLRCIYIK